MKYLKIAAIFISKNTLLIYREIKNERVKMKSLTRAKELFQDEYNPFEVRDNSALLKETLSKIDERDIRTKFKATSDPINLAFETLENQSLKSLAKDFITESLSDIADFITRICK